VSAAYEPPARPDLVLPTHEWPVDRCVDELVALLEARGVI
jgi:adenylylsulfate kinase-like enzyme